MAKRALDVISRGRYWTGPDGETWQLSFHFAVIDGRRECVGVDIRSTKTVLEAGPDGNCRQRQTRFREFDPHPLNATTMRRIPIAALIRQQALDLSLELMHEADDTDDVDEAAELREAAETLGKRPTYGKEHFERVAAIYAEAWANGLPPTLTVAEELHASRSAAAKWVSKARQMNLLGATEQRRPGGVAPAPAKKGGRK